VYHKDSTAVPTSMLMSGIVSPQPHVGLVKKQKSCDDVDLANGYSENGISLHLDRSSAKSASTKTATTLAGGDDECKFQSSVDTPTIDEVRSSCYDWHSLNSGLVDYVFIAGNIILADDGIPINGVAPGPVYAFAAESCKILSAPQTSSMCPPPAFSPDCRGTTNRREDTEIGIWDRFPQVDYPQSPLPGKVQ
jgi:hypothetical protein